MTTKPLTCAIATLLALGAASPLTLASDASIGADTPQVTIRGSIADRAGPGLRVIGREEIDASGHASLADLLFDLPMATLGNRRPKSGTTGQPLAGIDLRGLGDGRTKLLVDGRPAAIDPFSGSSANLNTIPLAAVDRIEILASATAATLDTDATVGVVNIVLRQAAPGAQVSYQQGNPSIRGGDVEAGAASIGMTGDRGSMQATVSFESRGLVTRRDQAGGDRVGITEFGNNYRVAINPTTVVSALRPLPGFDCSGSGTGAAGPADVFYTEASGLCGYNFNAIQSANAATDTQGLQVSGNRVLDDRWTATVQASATRQSSFGRYAPTPARVFVAEGSPNDPIPGDGRGAVVFHRFAPIGPRDTTTDENAYDLRLGLEGAVSDRLDVSFGARHAEHQGYEFGRNYVVTQLAELAIQDGRYDLNDPFSVDRTTLDSIAATINRDALWRTREAFVRARFDAFPLPAGMSTIDAGLTWRDEDYADRFDSLQASGQISGSAGNSASGARTGSILDLRWMLPVHESIDVTVAALATDDHDFGADTTTSAAVSWRPWSPLQFHAAWASGQRLPELDALFGDPATSAQFLADQRTCLARGRQDCNFNPLIQVDVVRFGNAALAPEPIRQWNAGLRYAPSALFSFEANYHHIRVDERIVVVSPSELIQRDNLGAPLPDGLAVIRDPLTGAILRVEQGYGNIGHLEVDGLDMRLQLDLDAGRFGQWRSVLDASHVLHYRQGTEFANGEPFVWDFAGSSGVPEQRATWRTQWSLGDWRVTATTSATGDQEGDSGRRTGTFATHDLQVAFTVAPGATIALGATNLADRMPPLNPRFDTEPFNGALYPRWGRTPYVRLTYAF